MLMAATILLASCGGGGYSQGHRQILDEYKTLNMRVDERAAPILLSGAEFCEDIELDTGITWHKLSDYPQTLQPVVQDYWDIDEKPSVFFVRANSPASRAGIKAKTRPDEKVLAGLQQDYDDQLSCAYPVLIAYSDEINAYATGDAIIITSGMIRAIEDDLYLSLVIAHELAHNILNHVEQTQSAALERDADHVGLILLARAGMDIKQAVKARTKTRIALLGEGALSEEERARMDDFKDMADAIYELVEAKQELNIKIKTE